MNPDDYDVNNFKSIKKLLIDIKSKSNDLNIKQLKEFLILVRTSRILPDYKITYSQIKEIEQILLKRIEEETPFFKTKNFYITCSVAVIAVLLTSLFNCFIK